MRCMTMPLDDARVLPFASKRSPASPGGNHQLLSGKDRGRIMRLREFARKSLLCSSTELDQACLVIGGSEEDTIESVGLALFGALGKYATRRLIMYGPSARSFSESEIWLSRMIASFETADTAQGRALVAWRIRPEGHRRVRFLAGLLADRFQKVEGRDTGEMEEDLSA